MLEATPFRSLGNRLRMQLSWDYQAGSSIVMLTSMISAFRFAYNMGLTAARDTPEYRKCLNLGWHTIGLSFLDQILLLIIPGLFISAIGLWSRRVPGFLLSMLALAWVSGSYFLWYLNTLSVMRGFEVQDFAQVPDQRQHLLILLNATWWDVVVLVVTIAIFIWQTKTLIIIFRSSHH